LAGWPGGNPVWRRPKYCYATGRYPDTVEARSVLCYLATRGPGITTLELSKTAWHFTTHGGPIGKMGRKYSERKATQGDGMFSSGRYFYAVFMCHLSIEKSLKGLY